MYEQEYILIMRYIIVRGELLLYTPVVVRSNRIPPPCVFVTQDSTRKDSTQNFNIKSYAHELAHIRARESQTHTAMRKNSATTKAQQVIAEQNAAAQTASVESTNAAQAQPAATPLAEGTVKKFTVQVKRVQLFEKEDIVNVQLTLNKAIPGFVKNEDDEFVPDDTDRISMSRSTLTRALCEHDEFIATMRDGQSTPLSRAQISTVLHGAVLTVTRTYHAAGYVEEGREPIARPQWFTAIEDVVLSKFAQQLTTQLVMQRMLG